MTDLPALLGRLRAATGPDRTLDADICVALGYAGKLQVTEGWTVSRYDNRGRLSLHTEEQGVIFEPAPALTGSIDAAVALVERMLPGACWTFTGFSTTKDANPASRFLASVGIEPGYGSAYGPTLGIAILIATIEALMAREGSDE